MVLFVIFGEAVGGLVGVGGFDAGDPVEGDLLPESEVPEFAVDRVRGVGVAGFLHLEGTQMTLPSPKCVQSLHSRCVVEGRCVGSRRISSGLVCVRWGFI
jgi:hypothetical protein